MTVRILKGDCREVLRELPPESVHCVVTSPPYWGLRDYGVAPSIWGGDHGCTHVWGPAQRTAWANSVPGPSPNRPKNGGGWACDTKVTGPFCARCGAWKGAHGLEPTLDMFVTHETAIFAEVRRVLRDDGTLWLNLGDSYATGAGKGGGAQGDAWAGRPALGSTSQFRDRKVNGLGPMTQPNRMPQPGLKSKDLCGIPWRVAFALQADGWYLRQDIIWSKPNPMPESVRDRCTKAHEYLFLLSKSERYFWDRDAIAEPFADSSLERLRQDVANQKGSDRVPGKTNGPMKAVGLNANRSSYKPGSASHVNEGERIAKSDAGLPLNEAGRNRRSVWTVNTEGFSEAHFATFPPALIEPCILAGCPAGGTVLDPFGGAGTTGLVADRLGRDAILIELNPEYAAMAERRIRGDAPLFAEVSS